MPAWPDAAAVVAFLARASRRLVWLGAIRGAALGLAGAAVLVFAAWLRGWPAPVTMTLAGVAVTAGTFAGALHARRSNSRTAERVEACVPACRNVVITAAEIIGRPDAVREYVGARVCRDAARAVDGIRLATIFPARPALLRFAIAFVLAAAGSLAVIARAPAPRALAAPLLGGVVPIRSIEVTITPPAYTGRGADTLLDPESVTAIAGSRLDVVVHGDATGVVVETATGRLALDHSRPTAFTGSLTADADGFIAIEARAGAPPEIVRRLIGVRATADARPIVRIVKPGQDLLVPDGNRVLALEIAAEDDLALATLRLTYTKVTGSGENFTFADGEVPLAISRAGGRTWTATASWPLAPLGLLPGDMLVYRAVASDRKPGAAASESDAFIVEVLAPGSVAAEGFAIEEKHDRYAISQQMVILKTERLIARRGSLSAGALAEEAHLIAAEQRQVRAEFVFMMGGHVEDEEVEAAGEEEIAAGRLVNRGRVDLVQAIGAMSEAAASLTAGDLTAGLGHERRALAALQRAFTRSRYILRTLSERERVDDSRRLTGALTGLAREPRAQAAAATRPRVDALRRALIETSDLAARQESGAAEAAQAERIAAAVLQIEPGSEPLRLIATALERAAAELRAARAENAGVTLSGAIGAIAAALRRELARAQQPAADAGDRVIDGALADALRRSVRR